MGQKYILIATDDANVDKVIETVIDMDYLIKIDKSGKKTKVPYGPAAYDPEGELIKYINKNHPDMEFLITSNFLVLSNTLKYGRNITFEAGMEVSAIAGQYKNNQFPFTVPNALKTETFSKQINQTNIKNASLDDSSKNKSSGDGLLFFILLLIILILIYYSGDITPGLEGLDLGSIVNIK